MRHKIRHIDIEIDKLTNSIENVITGDSFPTDVSLIKSIDLKDITKKNGWLLIGNSNLNNLTEMFIN